ncbi:MAG: ATP synthase subunit I [Halarsenatibacteraceae bacterium]
MDNLFAKEPAEVVKLLTKRVIIVGLFLVGSAAVSQELDAVLGLIFGMSISLLLFRLKLVQSKQAIELGSSEAEKYMRNRSFVNYFIYFIVLFVAFNNQNLSFLGAAIGLLILKFTIIGSAIIEMVKTGWQNYMKDE